MYPSLYEAANMLLLKHASTLCLLWEAKGFLELPPILFILLNFMVVGQNSVLQMLLVCEKTTLRMHEKDKLFLKVAVKILPLAVQRLMPGFGGYKRIQGRTQSLEISECWGLGQEDIMKLS